MVSYEKDSEFLLLVQKARQGDRAGMDKLVRLVEPRLRAHFLRITLDIDLTGDLTQETMLRMIKHLRRLESTDSFWPWVFRIASNITKDHYRDKQRRTAMRFSAMEEHQVESVLKDDSARPELGAYRREACSMLNNAISALKQQHRQVLTMRCFDNMSYAQIGESFGCTEVAARTTLSRAKKFIGEYLQKNGLTRI